MRNIKEYSRCELQDLTQKYNYLVGVQNRIELGDFERLIKRFQYDISLENPILEIPYFKTLCGETEYIELDWDDGDVSVKERNDGILADGLHTKLSQGVIANKYGVSQSTVSKLFIKRHVRVKAEVFTQGEPTHSSHGWRVEILKNREHFAFLEYYDTFNQARRAGYNKRYLLNNA